MHLHDQLPHFCAFSLIIEDNLNKIIMGENSKSCRLDHMPTFLLKSTLPNLLPALHMIVNKSFACGVMPNSLKIANVTPLLKTLSLAIENFKNFRPVSNLPYIGKLIEKMVVSQIDKHMTSQSS